MEVDVAVMSLDFFFFLDFAFVIMSMVVSDLEMIGLVVVFSVVLRFVVIIESGSSGFVEDWLLGILLLFCILFDFNV